MFSSGIDNILRFQWDHCTIGVSNQGSKGNTISKTLLSGITSSVMYISRSFWRTVIRSITSSIMDIGFSNRVHKASMERIIHGVWKGIWIGTKAISVREYYRGSSILRGGSSQGNTNQTQSSEALHVSIRQTARLPM